MRLVQQTPAWSLHAYMRFLGIAYTTENTVAFKALGQQLPVLVDKVHSKTETLAMNYLCREYGNITSSMSTETVFSAYLKQSLVVPFQQLKRIGKIEEKELSRVLPFGLNIAVNAMSEVRDFFCGDRYDALPGATEHELLEYLRGVYGELNESLLNKIAEGNSPTFTVLQESELELQYVYDNQTPPSSPQRTPRSPQRRRAANAGVAEAVLFGHLAEVLCTHEPLTEIVLQYEGLLSFFQYICSTYFAVPYAEAVANGRDRLQWKGSMDALLNNKFFTTPACDRVRQCLLHGIQIPCTKAASTDEDSYTNMRQHSASNAYDDDIYPSNDSFKDNFSNPLAHHSQQQPASSPKKPISGSLKGKVIASDPYLVRDQLTAFSRVNLDLSLSAEWRRMYNRVGACFGARPGAAAAQGMATQGGAEAASSSTAMTAGSDRDGSLALPQTTVTLGGVVMLLSVTGCFAGYTYYTAHKKR